MIVPRYGPGAWLAVVTDGHICLLPPDVDVDTVTVLWAAVREGAGLTAQLQLLLAGGLDALPPFALVALGRDRVHVVVRGDVEVQVDGPEPRTVRGRRVATWQEDAVEGASGVVVRVLDGGATAESRLPVLSGVVHADVVAVDLRVAPDRGRGPAGAAAEPRRSAATPAREAPAPTAPAPTAPAPTAPASTAPASTAPASTPLASTPPAPTAPAPTAPAAPAQPGAATPAPPAASAVPAATEPAMTPTPAAAVPPLPVAAVPVPSPPSAAAEPVHALDDLEHTVLHAATDTSVGLRLGVPFSGSDERWAVPPSSADAGPSADVPSALPPAAPQQEIVPAAVPARQGERPVPEDDDHDGTTVLSSDVVALRRQLPEWAGDGVPALAVPAPNRPAPAKIRLSSGLVVSLNRPVLLGRAPQVSRVSNREMPRLITVASPRQDISRTHAEVRMDGDDVLVTDLRSTNGVLLLRQGHGPQRLHPGEPTVVEPGVSVDLGEGVTFVVERGA